MKKTLNIMLRKLLCSGLIIAMVLFNAIAVFAIEEVPEVQPASSSETDEPDLSEPVPDSTAAETANTEAVPDQDGPAEAASIDAEDVSADIEVPEQPAGESDNSDNAVETTPAPSEPTGSEAETAPVAAAVRSTAKAAKSSSGKSIWIGETSFDSGDDESSHWSDGKGWKNISGQYIAMVDFNGSEEEISADEGVITLAVAGVNKIRALKGNCSYNIIGSGIVLIDSIEIEDGNSISLTPNTAIYDEGSAAVFLKDGDSYKLINGSIPGILDESYVLDNVKLVVPEGSVLNLSAMCVRTETWVPEGSDEPVTDVTLYTTDMPTGSQYSSHTNGTVSIMDCGSRLVIGKNSTLTIDSKAAVQLSGLRTQNNYLNVINPKVVGELIVQGVLNVTGVIEGGGFIDVQNGGTLSGTGAVRSAEVDLEPGGNLNVALENSILTIYSNTDGSSRVAAPAVTDSIIYLRGSNIFLSDLNVSGSSTLSIDTDTYNGAGNITLGPGSNLDITINKYDDALGLGDNDELLENLRDGLTDAFMAITGKIIGGTVSVLAGCVKYTGTDPDVFPLVPDGYASRVLVSGNADIATEDPLNMTTAEAESRAKLDQIPVIGYVVFDEWEPDKGMYRVWRVEGKFASDPLSRSNDQKVTVPDLLRQFGLLDERGYVRSSLRVGVELIYSDFSRHLYKAIDYYPTDIEWAPLPLDNVVMVRVLQYMATGGFGGSSSTHTIASVTGSGVIGGPGSGNVQAGKGAVIYGVKYVEPEPVKPEPVDPDLKKPEQHDTDNGGANGGSRRRSARADSVKTVTAVNGAGLDVIVSRLELTAEDAANHPDMPQIWQLSITDGGIPVTDLSGSPIEVAFPFTVPESWGDPAEIDRDSLYAVFADEGELTAYKAEYDPETGELRFETEQTGYFVIVQFKYGDKPFTEDFYQSLAELKEIEDFLMGIQ